MGFLYPGGTGGDGGPLEWEEVVFDFAAIRAEIGSDHDLVPGTPGTKSNAAFPIDLLLKNGTNPFDVLQIETEGLVADSSLVVQDEEAVLLARLDDAFGDYAPGDIIRVLLIGSSNVDNPLGRPSTNSRWGLALWADDDASDPNITCHNRYNGAVAETFIQRRDGLTGGTNDETATDPADSEYTILEATIIGPFLRFLAGRGVAVPDYGTLDAAPADSGSEFSQVDDDAAVIPAVTPVHVDSVGVCLKKVSGLLALETTITHLVIQRLVLTP